jgi:arylsulfatase A-like enzyme
MKDRPNVLLVLTDQQRADHLGCYGNQVLHTPNIDALATRGVVFERFYVTSPVCMPNRASLMTGRLPSLHGVRSNGLSLHFGNVVFTELLRVAGYRTALVGKSHLQNMTDREPLIKPVTLKGLERFGENPEARHRSARGAEYEQELRSRWSDSRHRIRTPYYGFEHVELCNGHGDDAFGDYSRWLAERHSDPGSLCGPANALPDSHYSAPQAWRTRVPEELYSTHYVAERSVSWLKEHAQSGGDRPFFLMASFPDPHHPFTPPGRYWDSYRPEDIALPRTCRPPTKSTPPHVRWLHEQRASGRWPVDTPRLFATSEREAREIIALTYGMIRMIDDRVGLLLAALRETGLDRRTIVIFTSDHGDYMGDHGLMLKGPMHYEGVVRVPFIWTEPGNAQGKHSSALAGTLDVARTILARAGIDGYNGMQGRSLMPVVEGRDEQGADAVLIEEDSQRAYLGFAEPIRVRTVVTKRWRLTLYRGVQWGELYDLENDPDEERNLWDDAGYHGIRAAMAELLARAMMDACDRSPFPTRSA